MPMERNVSMKSLISKIPVIIFQVQLAMITIPRTESSKLLENAQKNNSGDDVGSRSASEFFRRMFSLKRLDSESSTEIDR